MTLMRKAQFQISVFHLLAVVLAIILVIYVGISQNRISVDTVTSNTQAQHLQLVRRLFMSSDCLAYESRDYTVVGYGDLKQVYSSREVNPFVVDLGKFYNWENFNCLRGVYGDHTNPSYYRLYYIHIVNLENGEIYSNEANFPKDYTGSGDDKVYNIKSPDYLDFEERRRLCTGVFFYDTIPIVIYDQGRFYNGLAYIEDCIIGEIVSRAEILYGG